MSEQRARVPAGARRLAGPLVALSAPLVLAGALAGCSTPPTICSALQGGQDPLTAARTAYGDAGDDGPTAARMLRQGAADVRAGCPDRDGDATALDSLAAVVEIGS